MDRWPIDDKMFINVVDRSFTVLALERPSDYPPKAKMSLWLPSSFG